MLQRTLARENVAERTRDLLATSGVKSYRQLISRPLWDVAHAADVSVQEMTEMISKVSVRLAPRSQSVFDMFLESVNRPMRLRTGLLVIDTALRGGLHCGAIHEFAGASGIGKTQLAMTLAVICALEYPKCTVLYLDTERGFSAKRLAQIARARLQARFVDADLDDQVDGILRRVLVHRIDTLAVLLARLKDLDDEVPARHTKLIVLDSIASVLVKAHDLTFAQREHHIQRTARHLKYIGDVHQAFIVVTNRANTVDNEFTSFTKPLLGDTWAHCVTSRFILERHISSRVIAVIKCPSSDYAIQPFNLTEIGVVPAEELLVRNTDDDDFDIHDDVLGDLDLAGVPTVDPSGTLRSTQQSESSAQDEVPDVPTDITGEATATVVDDDIVCDSNEESGSNDESDSDHDGWLPTVR